MLKRKIYVYMNYQTHKFSVSWKNKLCKKSYTISQNVTLNNEKFLLPYQL